jgi:hypothetical protein
MPASYRTTAPDGSGVVSAPSPEAIRDFLGSERFWPHGCYEITRVEVPFGHPHHRWGVAIKHPDGTVELIPDPPA